MAQVSSFQQFYHTVHEVKFVLMVKKMIGAVDQYHLGFCEPERRDPVVSQPTIFTSKYYSRRHAEIV